MTLTRDELMAAASGMPLVKKVPLPEGLGDILVRQIDEDEAESLLSGDGDVNRAHFIVMAVANPDGTRQLTDADLPIVEKWPFAMKMRIWMVGSRFSSLIGNEDAAKNPETTAGGCSRCDSAERSESEDGGDSSES